MHNKKIITSSSIYRRRNILYFTPKTSYIFIYQLNTYNRYTHYQNKRKNPVLNLELRDLGLEIFFKVEQSLLFFLLFFFIWIINLSLVTIINYHNMFKIIFLCNRCFSTNFKFSICLFSIFLMNMFANT